MRRLSFVVAFLACGAGSCVTDDVAEPLPVRSIDYTSSCRKSHRSLPMTGTGSRVTVPPATSAVGKAPPRSCPPAWMPRWRPVSPRWTSIVIHHSGTDRGGAKAFDRYHRDRNGWDELGYHFVIGNGSSTPDGYVEVGPRWHKQKHGAHCKTPGNYYNEHGIGICLVGNFNVTGPTRKQLASLDNLLRFLMERCGICPGQVTTHREITGRTDCPGRRFPIARIRRAIAAPVTASSMP